MTLCHQEEYLVETSLGFKQPQYRNNNSSSNRGLQAHLQQLLTYVEEIFYVEFWICSPFEGELCLSQWMIIVFCSRKSTNCAEGQILGSAPWHRAVSPPRHDCTLVTSLLLLMSMSPLESREYNLDEKYLRSITLLCFSWGPVATLFYFIIYMYYTVTRVLRRWIERL